MNSPVKASSLRHRLILQKPVYARDEMGGTIISWQDSAKIWASITPLREEESFRYYKTQGRRLSRIRLRYREDIHSGLRFRKGERVFSVLSTLDRDEERHTLELICEEITA